MSEFWKTCACLDENGTPFVVVTITGVRGHAPQDLGAKAVVTADGLHWGTVGGGKIEARALQEALAMLRESTRAGARKIEPKTFTWNLQRDIGMTCGGEVVCLFELHRRENWRVAVFGAGHVAQALVRTLSTLDCQVVCIDPRPEWLDRLPESKKIRRVLAEEPARMVAEMPEETFFVVMTKGHATDMPVLAEILRRLPSAPYVGAIGSDVKALKIRSELKSSGINEETVGRLRCPIGLPLGGNDPAEIAISIAAELIQERDRLRKT